MSQADETRYLAALHAMQSGVAFTMAWTDETEPKHLRVGVNAAMSDHAALIRLLIAKGVFTLDEYQKELADEMEREVQRYKDRLTARHPGTNIELH